jgi:hypothetical protein
MKVRSVHVLLAVLVGCGKPSGNDRESLASASAPAVATTQASPKTEAPAPSVGATAGSLPPSARRALIAYERGDWDYLQQLADKGVIPKHQIAEFKRDQCRVGAPLERRVGSGDPSCTKYRYQAGPRDQELWVHEVHLSVCGPDDELTKMYVFGW